MFLGQLKKKQQNLIKNIFKKISYFEIVKSITLP